MRKSFEFGVRIAAAAFLVAGTFAGAAAQTPRPGTVTPGKGENYDPVGMPVGSFRVFPVLELVELYNSNVYATSGGTRDDFVTVVRPGLELRSNWNNHMLNFFTSGAFGFYAKNSRMDYQDFRVGSEFRVDIQRQWNIYGGAQFNRLHEDPGSPNATPNAITDPNKYNQSIANLGYYQRMNRFSARLDGRVDNYKYTNNRNQPGGASITNRDRDRTEWTESLRLGYELVEKYEIWVQGGLNQRNYNRNVDSAGFRRDSTGWEALLGATIDFGGITQVEAFVGYRDQDYSDSRLGHIRGVMFGMTGFWNPIVPLFVKPFVKRTIEETVSTTQAGYWATAFGVNVDYAMRPNVKINGGFSYTINDYKRINTPGATSRNDDYINFEIGLRYLPTENFYVGPSYQFTNRNSNAAGNDFSRHLVALRGGVQF
ncbi:MAG: outer membrane beta-barrel protein [Rhodospirillales bacterium]|nr:MAG: outer membrane beta-barrel protein [Rhodospirillales bacterium]